MDLRFGQGFDAHRLVPGRPLILGGVRIPHPTGLLGHSDADVLVHAVMDAILGAAALGDIGQWFPDTDERHRGADSLELLRTMLADPRLAGWRVGNVDATVVAQAPRLAPHVPAMRENLARALGVAADRVSVKATTTEALGFCGRGEGIAALAVATIARRTKS
jgi:2-C-methyl-D-erythritol 2,4-cyclodiphosphate synthase